MSVWIKTEDQLPPINEEVLILYKDKKDKLCHKKLYYGIAKRIIHKIFPSSPGFETWSNFTEYQGYYEVVYWTPLVDMPKLR